MPRLLCAETPGGELCVSLTRLLHVWKLCEGSPEKQNQDKCVCTERKVYFSEFGSYICEGGQVPILQGRPGTADPGES